MNLWKIRGFCRNYATSWTCPEKQCFANLTTVESQSEQNKITDLSAYNVYMGWYAGKVEDCGAWMDSSP